MLSEELGKLGDGDMALVETVGRLQRLETGQTSLRRGRLGPGGRVGEDAAGGLEDGEGRRRVTGVGDRREDIVGAYSAGQRARCTWKKAPTVVDIGVTLVAERVGGLGRAGCLERVSELQAGARTVLRSSGTISPLPLPFLGMTRTLDADSSEAACACQCGCSPRVYVRSCS